MASTINADVTNGLVLTPDTSGEIKLQAGGADIATVSSTGIAMASGKTITGNVGKVLQVISNTKHTTSSTTSTSYVATGHTVSITPSSISSKILIMIHGGNVWNNGTSANMVAQFYVDIAGGGYNSIGSGPHLFVENLSGGAIHKATTSGAYLHSPSTTSTLTYQPYFKVNNSTGYYNEATLGITLTAMEIAG